MGTGAYGYRIEGVTSSLLAKVPDAWPPLTIATGPETDEESPTQVGSESGCLNLAMGGSTWLRRVPRSVEVRRREAVSPDVIVHPLLAAFAGVFARWDGRETFHAGAVVVAGQAWGVAAPSEGGKSTFLAATAAAGHAVLSDDLLVLAGDEVLVGPRAVDLRESTTRWLEPRGAELVRDGSRTRIALPPVAPAAKLAGWVFLEWGEELSLRPLMPAERIVRVAAQRSWNELADPDAVLQAAALPALLLTRPRRFDVLDRTVEKVVQALEA